MLRPYTWYDDLVLAGAGVHDHPVAYIAQFIAVIAVPHLDRERGVLALKAINEYYKRQSTTQTSHQTKRLQGGRRGSRP
jgi:hypothetical protein